MKSQYTMRILPSHRKEKSFIHFSKQQQKKSLFFLPSSAFFFFRFKDVYTRLLFLRVFFSPCNICADFLRWSRKVELRFTSFVVEKKVTLFFFAVDANRTWNTFDVLLVGSPQVTSACSSLNAFHSRSPSLSLYWSILSSAERCKLHNRARGYFFQYVFVLLIFLPIKKKRWWMSFTACCFLINHVINNCAT